MHITIIKSRYEDINLANTNLPKYTFTFVYLGNKFLNIG